MNTPTQHPPLTRKEISTLLANKVSVWQLRRYEKDWGLDKARIQTGTRQVLFRHTVVLMILRNRGFEV